MLCCAVLCCAVLCCAVLCAAPLCAGGLLSPCSRDGEGMASPKSVGPLCRSAAASILQTHGAALRRAAVAQWEVRLRVGDRSGAWRIVVSIPTGASSCCMFRHACLRANAHGVKRRAKRQRLIRMQMVVLNARYMQSLMRVLSLRTPLSTLALPVAQAMRAERRTSRSTAKP